MSKLFAQSSTSNQGQHQEEASDQVDYTISQDRAAGNFAQEEFNYQLLMSNRFDFLSPSASFVRPGWNDALRDDQLQLRLPEQQNRKGLIIPSQAGDALLVSFLEARESRKRKLAELEEEVNFNSEKDDNRGGRNGGQDTDRPDENHQPNNLSLEASHHALQDLEASQPTRDPNKYCSNTEQSQAESSKPDKIQGQHDECAAVNDACSDLELNTNQQAMGGYCILYRVVCSDRHECCHLRTYLDEPRRVAISRGIHIIGNTLVPNLDDFLQGCNEVIAFIVYRDYFCGQSIRPSLYGPSTYRPGTNYYQELFSIVSEDLHAIIQQRSKFAPNHDAYKLERFDPNDNALSPALSMSLSEYSHRFLYHHRAELNREAATATEGSAIRALSSYLIENLSNMYSKCDRLFSQGLVSHDTLPWLFHPNDVLVASKSPLEIAYVLRRFLIERAELELDCWNWGYDGHRLRRMDTSVSVGVPTYGTVRINELAVYPLRFATEETKRRLIDNGRQFWNLRHQSLVSYEGPDYKGECTYASIPWIVRAAPY